jgi:hypothetical protein
MNGKLVHTIDSHVEYLWKDRLLFRYVYEPRVAQMESPKPFLHPVNTLEGNLLTDYRPADHRWHNGIAMTFAELSGENFWGGPTYVRDKGYEQRNNNGRQKHVGWDAVRLEDDLPVMEELLSWITESEEEWLHEHRRLRIADIDDQASRWALEFHTRLENASGRALILGSPTTQGRPAASYGSLFWRAARSLNRCSVLTESGIEDAEQAMGSSSAWLAYSGFHDGRDGRSTLVFVDDPSNPRYPTKWFVRNQQGYNVVSYAFMFDEEYELGPADNLELTYHLIVADGPMDRKEIGKAVSALPGLSASAG